MLLAQIGACKSGANIANLLSVMFLCTCIIG